MRVKTIKLRVNKKYSDMKSIDPKFNEAKREEDIELAATEFEQMERDFEIPSFLLRGKYEDRT